MSDTENRDEIPITFNIFENKYGYPSRGSLRKMAYEAEFNGLKAAFLKVGRRRLILPETLFRLLKEKGSK